MEQLKIQTPAKINLYLSIKGHRDDGYHELESFMIPIALYDELTISRSAKSINTTCPNKPELDGESNLAHRAAQAWLDASGTKMGVQIEIHKRIPIEAGLGGGSSDAGATLQAMQLLGKKPLSDKHLHAIATKLGADVPFFLDPHPRVVRGIGELLGPVQDIEPFWLLLALAPFGLPTREVFEDFTFPLTSTHIDVNDEPPHKWGFEQLLGLVKNDLEPTAESLHPEIARMRKTMKDAGALCASMSGSGPSVFSFFKTEKSARMVLEAIDGSLAWTYLLLRAIT